MACANISAETTNTTGVNQPKIIGIFGTNWQVSTSSPVEECAICRDNIVNYYVCDNHHKTCNSCCDILKKNFSSCPFCENILIAKPIIELTEMLKTTVFYCNKNYCNWSGEYSNLQAHKCIKPRKLVATPYHPPLRREFSNFYGTLSCGQVNIGTLFLQPAQRDIIGTPVLPEDRNCLRFSLTAPPEGVVDCDIPVLAGNLYQLLNFYNSYPASSACMCEIIINEPVYSADICVHECTSTDYYINQHEEQCMRINRLNLVKEDNVKFISNDSTLEAKESPLYKYSSQHLYARSKQINSGQTNAQIVMFGGNYMDILQKVYDEKKESEIFDCLNPFCLSSNNVIVYLATTMIPEINENGQVVKIIHREKGLFGTPCGHEIHIIPHENGNLLNTLIFKVKGQPDLIVNAIDSDNYRQQIGDMPYKKVKFKRIASHAFPTNSTKIKSRSVIHIVSNERCKCITNGVALEIPANAFASYPVALEITHFRKSQNNKGLLHHDSDSFTITGPPSLEEVVIELQHSNVFKNISQDMLFALVKVDGEIIMVKYEGVNRHLHNSVLFNWKLAKSQHIANVYYN